MVGGLARPARCGLHRLFNPMCLLRCMPRRCCLFIQVVLRVSGRNIMCFLGPLLGVSQWLLDLRLILCSSAFPSGMLRRSFWEGRFKVKKW